MSALDRDASGLSHYVKVLRRRMWLAALVTAVVTGLAVVVSLSQPALYSSSADVFLGNQSLPAALSNFQPLSFDPQRVTATQADLARVPAVARRALDAAGLRDRDESALLASSTVATAKDRDILTFTVTDHDAELAKRLATGYAEGYTSYRRQLDTAAVVKARRSLEGQLAELRAAGQRGTTLYRTTSENVQQLSTAEALQGSNASLVRSATNAEQIQPKPVRNGILGLVLGLVLGVALVFVRDALDTRVRSAEDVEEVLRLPLLGRIPEPPRRLRKAAQLMMITEPQKPEAEAYRILATNLGFVNIDRGARSIMVTSASRGEGKSTTIANLAVALARSGRRVVLVDMDLRRPSVDGFFGLQGRPGLTSAAVGFVTLDEALVRIPLVDSSRNSELVSTNGAMQGVLEVLPTGPLPPNAAEFAGSPKISHLLDQLCDRADIVLIDAPPLLHVSDTMALSAKVDALFAVASLSIIRRPMLKEFHRVLEGAPVVKLGFVLTGAAEDGGYGYGYGYGYGAAETRARDLEGVA